jgi:hypothetical protein
MKRLARKADRSVRAFLRFVAVVAALVAAVVYWNFGPLSPCGILREAIRQRGDLVAIFPDGAIDFAFEAQFGEMSARCCFAVLLEAVTSRVTIDERQSNVERRSDKDRRSGIDTRTEEEKRAVGERRSSIDRSRRSTV